MVERDLGSTYLMPQSKLYKPDNRVIYGKNHLFDYLSLKSVSF